MDSLPNAVDPASYNDEALKLWHKVQKLRWMGLELEAEKLAREIEELECGGSMKIAPARSSPGAAAADQER